jgi:hypothetical protein
MPADFNHHAQSNPHDLAIEALTFDTKAKRRGA